MDKVDIVILTALREERDAVWGHLKSPIVRGEAALEIHRAEVGPHRLVLLCMHGMGNARSGVFAQRAIGVWNPKYLILTGIIGGVQHPKRLLGDGV